MQPNASGWSLRVIMGGGYRTIGSTKPGAIFWVLKVRVRNSLMELEMMEYFYPVVARIVKTQRYSNFVIYHVP